MPMNTSRRRFLQSTILAAGVMGGAAASAVENSVGVHGPPAGLSDFELIGGQAEQWDRLIAGWTREVVDLVERKVLANGDICQYRDRWRDGPDKASLEQVIAWNALPNTLLRMWGRSRTLTLADSLRPLSERSDRPGPYFIGSTWREICYRPQDEYCEWRTTLDVHGKIKRIVFSAEPPEYWQALHGDPLPGANSWTFGRYPFSGDRTLLVDLYREFVDPRVRYEDLVAAYDLVDHTDPARPVIVVPRGHYNPWNRWNTTDGLMHLSHPANSLRGQLRLAVNCTVLRARAGRLITDPEESLCGTADGGPMRNSDLAIKACVNGLTRAGAAITLRDPVGIYIHHIDLAVVSKPDGTPVEPDYFRVLRGSARAGMISRAVFEVPDGEGFTVGDLTIGGVPITHAGQVAERISVAMYATAGGLGTFRNRPVECPRRCCRGEENPLNVRVVLPNAPCEPGFVPHQVGRQR